MKAYMNKIQNDMSFREMGLIRLFQSLYFTARMGIIFTLSNCMVSIKIIHNDVLHMVTGKDGQDIKRLLVNSLLAKTQKTVDPIRRSSYRIVTDFWVAVFWVTQRPLTQKTV